MDAWNSCFFASGYHLDEMILSFGAPPSVSIRSWWSAGTELGHLALLAGTDGREANLPWTVYIAEVSILRKIFAILCKFFLSFLFKIQLRQQQKTANLWQVIRVQSGGKARDGLMYTATVNIHGPRQHSLPCTHDSWKTWFHVALTCRRYACILMLCWKTPALSIVHYKSKMWYLSSTEGRLEAEEVEGTS